MQGEMDMSDDFFDWSFSTKYALFPPQPNVTSCTCLGGSAIQDVAWTRKITETVTINFPVGQKGVAAIQNRSWWGILELPIQPHDEALDSPGKEATAG